MHKWIGLLIFLVVSVDATFASNPAPSWGSGWNAAVTRLHCEINRNFSIPMREHTGKGFLDGTPYRGAKIRFFSYTRTHGDIVRQEDLGVTRLQLLLHPMYSATDQADWILRASLGGFEAKPKSHNDNQRNSLWLPPDESSALFEKFMRSEVVQFSIKFRNGKETSFQIYPSGNRTFPVLAAMFETCIATNRDK